MGRYKEAPFGFECPYQHACPHLGGISATWASLLLADVERDRDRDGHLALHAEQELETLESALQQARVENAQLRAENQALHQRQFQANRCKDRPGAPPDASGKPRKRGPPHGHPPWNRRAAEHVDRTVKVPAPSRCPHCGCTQLLPAAQTHTCRQEDIVLQPKTLVTDFVHDTALCPHCRRPVFQTAPDELRNALIGPVTKATAVFLRHEVKLSYRDIRRTPFDHPAAENLRQRLIDPKRDAKRLFTFLDVNGMPPTNNHAEQSLRLPVIFRKICFGNRSVQGAATLSTNLSLITTARRQQRDPLAFLQALLLHGPSAAQPLLYRRPLPDTS